MNRRVVAAFAALLLVGVALIAVGQATGGDDAPEQRADDPVPPTTAPPEPSDCGIDVPEVEGATAAPVCSLGFGIAIPDGWNATRLDAAALERLAGADLTRPSFRDAAVSVAATGVDFYAAGVDDDGSVSELKVDVQEGADTSPEAVAAAAQAVVDSGEVGDARIVEAGAERARVDYQLTLAAAEGGDDIEVFGTQLLVPDGDRLWSLIVTAEDAGRRDELVDVFSSSLTFD